MNTKLTLLTITLALLFGASVFSQHKQPSVVEVIGKETVDISSAKLLSLCKKQHIPASAVYRWKNHLVVYNAFANAQGFMKRVRSVYPGAEVKFYAKPFYEFNRQRCGDKTVTKQWDNILLTANLLKDTAMQNEYMRYHANQYKEWPEVGNGFCNANFQQLLVFRSGRQLMLVISIPKGASLDELNPKTTQNNPRVDDWNAIMKKYQEGISGTKPGETWVFLKSEGK